MSCNNKKMKMTDFLDAQPHVVDLILQHLPPRELETKTFVSARWNDAIGNSLALRWKFRISIQEDEFDFLPFKPRGDFRSMYNSSRKNKRLYLSARLPQMTLFFLKDGSVHQIQHSFVNGSKRVIFEDTWSNS